MATPRRRLMNPALSEVFHCTSRCVRRAFLCGWDPASGRDFEHRRLWIDERISELALYFGISVISSSVMSNHFHIVLRTEPQWVASLSDAEVARRWLCLFPGPGGRRGHPPEAQAVEDLCLDTKKLALCRSRLSDISWFMRCLNEPIARRANAEDECTGRFWEGRFKCRRLDGDAAILACMIYIDLNPVRAGMATTPESSDFTSGQARIIASQARRELAMAPTDPTPTQQIAIEQAKKDAQRDQWLVPFASPENEKGLEHTENADQRHIEHYQHQIADYHAGDHAPEQLWLFDIQLRSRVDPMNHQRAQHNPHHRAGRYAQIEQRYERCLRRRVVGRFRPGHSLDRTTPEALRCAGQFFLRHIRCKRGDHCAAAWQEAKHEAEHRAARNWPAAKPPILSRRQQVAGPARYRQRDDGIVGTPRSIGQHFTYEAPYLLDGINLVILAMGLFGVGEALLARNDIQPDRT